MYSTATFEGNLAADVGVKENKPGGVYVDAVVLVNQGKDSDGTDHTPTRWQVQITGRTAENAANLRKAPGCWSPGSVVTDSWTDKYLTATVTATRPGQVHATRDPSGQVVTRSPVVSSRGAGKSLLSPVGSVSQQQALSV